MNDYFEKISVVVLTKNEGLGIQKILKSLTPYSEDILVVDGHSTDQTKKLVQKAHCRFFLDHGLGRGDGLRLGITKAKNDVILFFDADGSHEVEDIPKLVEPILKGKVDMVIGSRRTGGSFDINPGFAGVFRSFGSDLLVAILNYRFKTKLTDILYSFRAIRKSIVPKLNLNSNGFTIEQEMVIKCLKYHFRILEIPSREKARAWGKSKLKTITGIKFIFHLLKECFF